MLCNSKLIVYEVMFSSFNGLTYVSVGTACDLVLKV